MKKETLLHLIKDSLMREQGVVFAYIYGSFIQEESFRDIDVGIYVKKPEENPFVITSDIKAALSSLAKQEGLNLIADQFDVRVINDAPFTFLKRVFKEGVLLVDNDPELRTDLIEHVSLKYRECAGLLQEVSTIH